MELSQPDVVTHAREPVFNLPPVVTALAGMLLGIHLLRAFVLPGEMDMALVREFGFIPARIFAPLSAKAPVLVEIAGRVAPFVTYSLFHGGLMHLGFNVIWLVALGSPVERRLGTLRFIAFALVGTALSAVFYGALHPHSATPMIGASGAISAMMGMLARLMYALRRGGRRSGLGDPGLLTFVGIWMVLNLASGLAGFGAGMQMQSIAWEAHLGGFLAGLLLAPFFDRRDDARVFALPLHSRRNDE